jgi:hypothetical protein
MRQANGTELLGPNDPRSSSIGIIYVSPNDDRKSVLAAIFTQEKLGRKEVAVVLLDQNKAFQRPVDFDDLKSMRRRLSADIVFIAPPGPGPAELARQRRFKVFSSLDNYRQALIEDGPGNEPKKRKFGAPSKQLNGSPPANGEATQQDENADRNPSPIVPFALGTATGAAMATNLPPHTPSTHSPSSNVDEPTRPIGKPNYDDEGDLLAPPPSAPPSTPPASFQDAGQPVHAGMSGPVEGDNAGGPTPIELPSRTGGRITNKLNPDQIDPQAPHSPRPRNTGKMAAVGGAAAAGLTTAAVTQRKASPPVTPPPTRTGISSGGPGSPRRRGRWRWLLALLLILLTLVLAGSALAYWQPSTMSILSSAIPFQQPAATITITPDSKTISDSYVVNGVQNNPDPNKFQISAHTVNGTAKSQEKTVNTTGRNQIAATVAKGTLTFYNSLTVPQTVKSGTVFTLANGVKIVNDTAAVIPAANLPTTGVKTVPAHATTTGAAGNIKAFTINQGCCAPNITVQNTAAFTGGKDAVDYRFVTQADVNNVVNPLRQPLIDQAMGNLRKQVAQGEQLVDNPNCNVEPTSSELVGDRGVDVRTVTVSVEVKCTGQAYNQQQAFNLVRTKLQEKVTNDPELGSSYGLVGNIQVKSTLQNVPNKISLVVEAKGIWAYQVTDTVKQELARLIAGKQVDAARTALENHKGISAVKLEANGDTLPTDIGQIKFVVQPIQGLPPISGTAQPATPTVINGAQSTPAVPGNGSIRRIMVA